MRKIGMCLAVAFVIFLSGCSQGPGSIGQNAGLVPAARHIQGVVHGGQQPVTNATSWLFTSLR
jgi:hypothetical protein